MGNVNVTGPHTVKIEGGTFENALLKVDNSTAFVAVFGSIGVTVHGVQGNYYQAGNETTNTLNSVLSGIYCMVFETGFTSVYLGGGAAIDSSYNHLPI